jgi:hypothetical protein
MSEKSQTRRERPLNPPILGDFGVQNPPVLGGRGALRSSKGTFQTPSQAFYLEVLTSNLQAQQFYTKLGFEARDQYMLMSVKL